MIPQGLKDVAKYLNDAITTGDLKLPNSASERRYNSITAEGSITKALGESDWNIERPNGKRPPYDLRIEGKFVDIKVSDLENNSFDNASAKSAIYYFLTGISPEDAPVRYDKYFLSMSSEESPDEDRDFYFLVVDKSAGNDVFFVSLKGLPNDSCLTNANNPPFQVKWRDAKNPEPRSWREAKDFLLAQWQECLVKQDASSDYFEKAYPDLFPDPKDLTYS